MKFSYGNITLLAVCQALMMSAMSLITATSSLVGYELATDKSYATLPFAMILIATMFTSIPAAKLMERIGRKPSFILASFIGISGGVVSTIGIIQHEFWIFLIASMLIGIFNGFGIYYRFTAADAVDDQYKARAISYVLAGGVLAAIIGPNLANYTQALIEHAHFAGSYASLIVIYVLSLLFLLFLKLPDQAAFSTTQISGDVRPLRQIIRQPKCIVAIICGMLGYGVMSFVMTATPLAMHHHAYPFSETAFVIQWHVLGMFAPSFFTGHLIKRFGLISIMSIGAIFGLLSVAINLSGTTASHFFFGLLLLGISWNFLFIGATTMLTETYARSERFKTQALNDFIVFTVVAIASLSAGALQHRYGWQTVNYGAIPALVIILLSLLWLQIKNRTAATVSAAGID